MSLMLTKDSPPLAWLCDYAIEHAPYGSAARRRILEAFTIFWASDADDSRAVRDIVVDVLNDPDWGARSYTEEGTREWAGIDWALVFLLWGGTSAMPITDMRRAVWEAWVFASEQSGKPSLYAPTRIARQARASAAYAALVACGDVPHLAVTSVSYAAMYANRKQLFHKGLVETVLRTLKGG